MRIDQVILWIWVVISPIIYYHRMQYFDIIYSITVVIISINIYRASCPVSLIEIAFLLSGTILFTYVVSFIFPSMESLANWVGVVAYITGSLLGKLKHKYYASRSR